MENQKLEKFFQELGMEKLAPEKKAELVNLMTETLLKKIFFEVIERLSDSDQAVYGQMLEEKKSDEEIENFLKSKIPDYDAFLEKIIEDFKEEMRKTNASE